MVYQNFYNNHAGAIDKLAKVWEFIAKEFKHEENVIGYNILNEPWAGNVYKVKILPQTYYKKSLLLLGWKLVIAWTGWQKTSFPTV